MVGGLIGWLLTTYKEPANPQVVLPLYLLTLFSFYLHLLEEHVFGFAHRMSMAFALQWTDLNFNLLILLGGPMIWILGALGLYYRNPFGNFIVWFISFGMLLGEPAHFIFPLIEGGRYHYFPGMWTALFPMITAIASMVWMVVETRKVNRNHESPRNAPVQS